MYVYKVSGFSSISKKEESQPEDTATGFFLLLEGGEYHKKHFLRNPLRKLTNAQQGRFLKVVM